MDTLRTEALGGRSTNTRPQAEPQRKNQDIQEARRRRKVLIDCNDWLSRERQGGFSTPPNPDKFTDINEFCTAKNIWREKVEQRQLVGRSNTRVEEGMRRRKETSVDEGENQADVVMLEARGDPVSQERIDAAQRQGRNCEPILQEDATKGQEGAIAEGGVERGQQIKVMTTPAPVDDEEREVEVNSSPLSPSGIRVGAPWTIVNLHARGSHGDNTNVSWGATEDINAQRGGLLGAKGGEIIRS